MKAQILLVDDDPGTQFGFSRYLQNAGHELKIVSTLAEAKKAIALQNFNAVLLDLNLPDGTGIDWLPALREGNPGAVVIMITGTGDIPKAVEAIRNGADDFLTKPVNLSELEISLQKSLELKIFHRKEVLQKRLGKKDPTCWGESPSMGKALELATLAAENDSVILLQGETGTGKSLLSRWIYERSARKAGPFVEVNCSSLRGELLNSELFGHAKGAFTSAIQDKEGLVEFADGGTLFLDEIGDMEASVQAHLLKTLDDRTFRRVGETKVRSSDFRLICATNRNLLELCELGKFRTDLYYRICVFPIDVPSLRNRKQDLPLLARHIIKDLSGPSVEISGPALDKLHGYSWPGNVRELRNMLERALLLSRGKQLGPEHFPGLDLAAPQKDSGATASELEEIENIHILKMMDENGNDTVKASKALGISRASLYRRLEKIRKVKAPA